MTKILPSTVLMTLLLLVGGCMTGVTTKKVEKNFQPTGWRYNLPQPFLSVAPDGDGGVTVDVVYFPDPNNEYAVDSWSFISKHTVELKRENGIIKQLTWKPDDTVVAAQLLDSAANVAKTKIDADIAAKQNFESNRVKAQQAVDSAKLDYDIAHAETQSLYEHKADPKDIAAAEVREAKAKAKWLGLQGQLDAVVSAGFNEPQTKPNSFPQTWGPVLYRIVEDRRTGGVKLVAVGDQQQFETFQKPKKPATPLPPPNLRLDGSGVVPQANRFELKIQSDTDILRVDQGKVSLLDIKANTEQPKPFINQDAVRHLVVTVTGKLPAAEYLLNIPFFIQDGGKEKRIESSIGFKIQ